MRQFTIYGSLLLLFVLGLLGSENKLARLLSPQGTIDPATVRETYNPSLTEGVFDNKPVSIPSYVASNPYRKVLGATTAKKRIEIDLSKQRLYAYEDDHLVYDFTVSTGKWGRTPTGTFHIWTKFKSVLMTGGSRAIGTYYYLPNVPHTMYFYNEDTPQTVGYGLHAAYWHNNFGHPMSHGCINMRLEDAELLYYWAEPELKDNESIRATPDNPGTELTIYGEAPAE